MLSSWCLAGKEFVHLRLCCCLEIWHNSDMKFCGILQSVAFFPVFFDLLLLKTQLDNVVPVQSENKHSLLGFHWILLRVNY